MSTAFLTHSQLESLCAKYRLVLKPIADDGTETTAETTEYRIVTYRSGKKLFQGDVVRCGDFVQGYQAGQDS